jgi:hypothetical protein
MIGKQPHPKEGAHVPTMGSLVLQRALLVPRE